MKTLSQGKPKALPRLRYLLPFALLPTLFLAGCGQATSSSGSMGSTGATGASTVSATPAPKNPSLILSTTTSTMDTGLLEEALLPAFSTGTGYKVKPLSLGTGQAIKMGEKCEADVVLVHARSLEDKFVADGYGINRRDVMYNDFVLLGPQGDPAGAKGTKTIAEALRAMADKGAVFISRGDNSGTHVKEKELWKQAGLEPKKGSYQEAGQGMGQTLQIAAEKGGYTLSDRGTYLAQKGKIGLEIVSAGDKPLLNPYGIIEVNPSKCPQVNSQGARALSDFIVSDEGQKIIADFGKDRFGEPLFVADAKKS